MSDIRKKIERSSLGTKNAKTARRTISATAASKVVARATRMGQQKPAKNSGG